MAKIIMKNNTRAFSPVQIQVTRYPTQGPFSLISPYINNARSKSNSLYLPGIQTPVVVAFLFHPFIMYSNQAYIG